MPTPFQMRSEIETAIEETKEEIRNDYHGIHETTLFEDALDLFLQSGQGGIDFSQLWQAFHVENDKKGKNNIGILIGRLGKKLRKRGFTTRRRSAYEIVPLTEFDPSSDA